MTTLANLRSKLNGELGVDDDTETSPWTAAVRNSAISDGYAELWRVGVWKPVVETISTADDTWYFATTSMRELSRVEVRDSSGIIFDSPHARIEADGSGAYNLVLQGPIDAGYTMHLLGWAPFKSVFSGDSDTDDLPAEYNRIPLLKAKAILLRAQLSRFARYAERQSIDPAMNVTADQLIAIVAAAEREFLDEARRLERQRPRVMRSTRTLIT